MIVALAGGVGGARLADGLAKLLGRDELMVVVNTGDDFEHLGLSISPDIDTVLYTLSGIADPHRGWGIAAESWNMMESLTRLGGDDWFRLGDRDLATHIERTRRLRAGEKLSSVTADFARRLGIQQLIVPMSDDPVHTVVETNEGRLEFQQYFVRRRCEPAVRKLMFSGAETARAYGAAISAITAATTEAIIICPSNPYLSLGPLLALPAMRAALESAPAPIVAVSPLINGKAVKGPAAKIMTELGLEPNAANVAAHYVGILDGFVLDLSDAALARSLSLPTHVTDILMRDTGDRVRLARETLAFARRLR